MSAVTGAVSHVGSTVLAAVAEFGHFVRFVSRTCVWLVFYPGVWMRWRRLGPQFYTVGVATIPVVVITGTFIGMILSLENFHQFEAVGQEGKLGGLINVSVIKHIGPVLAAVMVAGRVGCALAADLGTMRVNRWKQLGQTQRPTVPAALRLA